MFALADAEQGRYTDSYYYPPTASAAPPALPPSVEEAYRRKCIQLKQRTSEVEDANDAARLRLARLKRQCEKMRLERAFLLEQLAKRTSTNVEDSDGSPSPPPTVSPPPTTIATPGLPLRNQSPPTTNLNSLDPSSSTPRSKLNRLSTPSQPKEKPLRIKRGHRKPSMLTSFETPPAGGAASSVAGGNEPTGRSGSHAFASHNNNLRQTQSPSSDAFSTQPGEGGRSKANGLRSGPPPRKPGTAFDLYSAETDANGGASDDKDELARGWKSLDSQQREAFESRAESEMAQYQKDKDAYDDVAAAKSGDATEEVDMDVDDKGPSSAAAAAAGGDDTEMGLYDTDPEETLGEKPDE